MDPILTKLVVVGAALAIVLTLHGRRHLLSDRSRRLLVLAVAATAMIGALQYVRLPPFQELEDRPVNGHDLTHYYLGAKYFPELGYRRIYACVIQATGNGFGARQIRDLRDNQLRPIPDHYTTWFEDCRQSFSAVRWAEFANDLHRMRGLMSGEQWRSFVIDGGFNPSPAWIVFGYPIANAIPISLTGIYLLTSIDLALGLLGIFMLVWAFGPSAAAVAVVGTTTLFAANEGWTLGSLLRWDWLFWLVAATALAKRGHAAWSGAAFALAVGVRVFPIIGLVGVAAYAIGHARSSGRIGECLRFASGFIAGAILIVVVSALLPGPVRWGDFFDNLARLAGGYSANQMGLRSALTYAWNIVQTGSFPVPNASLWANKLEAVRTSAWAHVPVAAIAVVVLFRQARVTLWSALVAGLALIPFNWAEMANYYYAYWGLLFLAVAGQPKTVAFLLGMNMLGLVAGYRLGETAQTYAILSLLAVVGAFRVLAATSDSAPGSKGLDARFGDAAASRR